ncbi:MAG TPA: hypothetical protein VMM76_23975 [Pirellulaceae bacterium]|nr:hypothetical protein [Pirellulaceae bacterium]
MQQLTKSLGSLSWALPLFGLQQMTNALRRSDDGTMGGDAIAAFDAVTRASIDQCGTSVRETFEVGDKMQRDMVDMMFQLVPMGDSEMPEVPMPGASCMSDMMNPMQMMRRFTQRRDAEARPHAQQPDESDLGWGPVPPID